MPKFVTGSLTPSVGATKAAGLQAISQKSGNVLLKLGCDVHWPHQSNGLPAI